MSVLTAREVDRRNLSRPSFLERLLRRELAQPPRASARTVVDYAELSIRGWFPEVVAARTPRGRFAWLNSYVEQLVTRDGAVLARGGDPVKLGAYFTAVALNTAGIPAASSLYQRVGITAKTAARYDQMLTDLGVEAQVPTWSANRLQRLEKRAKRYVVDGGLAAAAGGFDLEAVLADGELLGRMIDTLVFAQVAPEAALAVHPVRLHHLRTAGGREEIDLLAEMPGGRVAAIEVKASAAVGRRDARHLVWLRDRLGDRFAAGVVLHTGPDVFELDDRVMAAPISTIWT